MKKLFNLEYKLLEGFELFDNFAFELGLFSSFEPELDGLNGFEIVKLLLVTLSFFHKLENGFAEVLFVSIIVNVEVNITIAAEVDINLSLSDIKISPKFIFKVITI